jgi:hypothetical protein
MKTRIAATLLVGLLLLYPLSMGPAARLVSHAKYYGTDPVTFRWLLLNLKIYRPLLGDNALGRLMAKYVALWVPPPPGSPDPTDKLAPGRVVAPGS